MGPLGLRITNPQQGVLFFEPSTNGNTSSLKCCLHTHSLNDKKNIKNWKLKLKKKSLIEYWNLVKIEFIQSLSKILLESIDLVWSDWKFDFISFN